MTRLFDASTSPPPAAINPAIRIDLSEWVGPGIPKPPVAEGQLICHACGASPWPAPLYTPKLDLLGRWFCDGHREMWDAWQAEAIGEAQKMPRPPLANSGKDLSV